MFSHACTTPRLCVCGVANQRWRWLIVADLVAVKERRMNGRVGEMPLVWWDLSQPGIYNSLDAPRHALDIALQRSTTALMVLFSSNGRKSWMSINLRFDSLLPFTRTMYQHRALCFMLECMQTVTDRRIRGEHWVTLSISCFRWVPRACACSVRTWTTNTHFVSRSIFGFLCATAIALRSITPTECYFIATSTSRQLFEQCRAMIEIPVRESSRNTAQHFIPNNQLKGSIYTA